MPVSCLIDPGPRLFFLYPNTRIRTYGCAYCSSHTAVMGSVWKGSGLTLEKNSLAMAPVPDPKVFSKKELAAIKIAKKVTNLCTALY